jgi:hypothetical protein
MGTTLTNTPNNESTPNHHSDRPSRRNSLWRFCASRHRCFPWRGQGDVTPASPGNPATERSSQRRQARRAVCPRGILDHIYAGAIVIDSGAAARPGFSGHRHD